MNVGLGPLLPLASSGAGSEVTEKSRLRRYSSRLAAVFLDRPMASTVSSARAGRKRRCPLLSRRLCPVSQLGHARHRGAVRTAEHLSRLLGPVPDDSALAVAAHRR